MDNRAQPLLSPSSVDSHLQTTPKNRVHNRHAGGPVVASAVATSEAKIDEAMAPIGDRTRVLNELGSSLSQLSVSQPTPPPSPPHIRAKKRKSIDIDVQVDANKRVHFSVDDDDDEDMMPVEVDVPPAPTTIDVHDDNQSSVGNQGEASDKETKQDDQIGDSKSSVEVANGTETTAAPVDTVAPSQPPFYLRLPGPSMWDNELFPTLSFVNFNEPIAGCDEYTIGVPRQPDAAFMTRIDELAAGKRRYKDLYLHFDVDRSADREELMKHLGKIRAETVTAVKTKFTADDFPHVIRNKVAFVIKEEYSSMHSSAYLAVIKEMQSGKIGLKYFDTPIHNSMVARILRQHLKQRYGNTKIWKEHLLAGISIRNKTFKLTLKVDGHLHVENYRD